MRILLRARTRLLSSPQAQTFRPNSSSARPTVIDNHLTGSRWFSIFTNYSTQNLQLNHIHRRNIGIGTSVKSKQVPNVFKRTDPDGDYIYNGKSTPTMKRLKLYSFAMGICGIYSQPFLWDKSQLFADTGLAIQDSFSITGVFATILPVLIQFGIKKYVTDIRYSKETDEYTCSTISFFLLRAKIRFKVEDIQHTEIQTSGILVKIGPKNIPILLDAESFTEPEHYARIVGYDTRTNETITDGESIYSSPHTQSISRSKFFSYVIIFSGILAQHGLWEKWGIWGCSIAGTFMFMMPIMTHFRVKNVVLDMRYNKETDEYTCTTNSIFSFKNKIKFKVEDIQNLDAQTIFTSLKVGPKNVPLFIDKANFTDQTHYARLMGYDKLFEFAINVDLIDEVNHKSIEAGTDQKSNRSSSADTESKKK